MLKIITLNVGMLLSFTSCAPQAPNGASGVVGTWRWLSVGGNPVREPFFIRYYDNGIAASWPAPPGWATPNGASYGTYSVENNQLVLHREEQPAVRADFEIRDDKLIVIGRDSTRLVYGRVVPDRAPGSMPEIQDDGGQAVDGAAPTSPSVSPMLPPISNPNPAINAGSR